MTRREYLSLISELNKLLVPGTVLYPPADKLKGTKLLRYEILPEEILAVVESDIECRLEIYWTLDQVAQCTYKLGPLC